jgi:hypothetical protein
MTVTLTALARVKDWQALQELNNDILASAQAIKATRYQIYRNANDASLALLLIELLEPDDVGEMREALVEQLSTLPMVSLTDDRMWEPTGWKAIEGGMKEVEQISR